MKKFLTVLLALSVVFTYSFSAVGTVFAATDSDEFSAAVKTYKGELSYDGNGYLNDDVESNGWNGVISKTVIEAAIDAWADNVDLATKDFVQDNAGTKELNNDAKTDLWTAERKSDVEAAQYDIELAKLNDQIASIDLSAYNKDGKKALQEAIEDAEDAVAALTTKDVTAIGSVKDQITGLKKKVDENKNNLLSQVTETLADQVAELEKTLNDASDNYYVFAKDWFATNTVTSASAVAAKETFDTDFNALVAYFADCIDKYEAQVSDDETPFTTNTRLKDVINYFFAAVDSVNSPADTTAGYFQVAKQNLAQKDVWVTYYEKAATTAKAALKPDGTKKYYDADVDKLLADTKDAVEDDLWTKMNSGTWGTAAATAWNLTSIENTSYNLQAYRTAATNKFTTGDYDLDNWGGARADKVEAIQDEYAEKVLLAESVADIDALVKEAKAAIDAIMTKDEVDSVAKKVASRIKAAGYLTVCNTTGGDVTTATGDGFSAYFDVVVGSSATYKADIKNDALKAAAQVFVDAVLAEEDASITYKQIDEIIAANKDAAYEALKNVKTTAELKTEAEAVATLIKALPSRITIDNKDQVLAAQAAMDAYVENAGAKQTDVAKYSTLKTALTTIINAEAREVTKLIRALPLNVTVADADQIAAARKAYDEFYDTYGDYEDSDFTSATYPDNTRLKDAEKKLEKANLEKVAKMIEALNNDSSKAEIEAAKAAFDALKTTSKLALNDQLYNKLMAAVDSLGAKDIAAVQALKITTSTKLYKGSKIRVKWTVKGDASVADGFQVYKSTKAQKDYKFMGKTKKSYMDNKKNLKKGTRYFYKVRAFKVVDGVKYYSDWSNKGNRIYKK